MSQPNVLLQRFKVSWRHTCALREIGDIGVLEDLALLEYFGQATQTRAANDAHGGPGGRLGHQPVG